MARGCTTQTIAKETSCEPRGKGFERGSRRQLRASQEGTGDGNHHPDETRQRCREGGQGQLHQNQEFHALSIKCHCLEPVFPSLSRLLSRHRHATDNHHHHQQQRELRVNQPIADVLSASAQPKSPDSRAKKGRRNVVPILHRLPRAGNPTPRHLYTSIRSLHIVIDLPSGIAAAQLGCG